MNAPHDRCSLKIAPAARRQLAEVLPEGVALATHEFIVGPLPDNPHRVGKRLRPPLENRHTARRGTYRVIYRIDDGGRSVIVVDVAHRRDAYRSVSSRRRPDLGAGRGQRCALSARRHA